MEKTSTSELSPHSLTRSTPDFFPWQRSLVVLAALILAGAGGSILGQLGARALGTTMADIQNAHLTWGITAAQYLTYAPVLVVLALGLPWASGRSLADLGLRRIDRPALTAGAIGAVAMYVVTIGAASVQYLFTHQKPDESSVTLFTSTHDRALIASFAFLATIAAPFVEELVFRGFLFNAISRYTPVWAAAVLSGLVFGISHGTSAFLPLACSGVVLAYVYARSGSLAASMVTHALFNIVNLILLGLAKA